MTFSRFWYNLEVLLLGFVLFLFLTLKRHKQSTKMPKQLLCLLPILFPLISYSQIQITGVVKDSLQPIAFANVILTDNNGKMVTGTITEDDGSFNLTAQQGEYKLTVSFLGYGDWGKNLSVSKSVDLGVIVLETQDNELEEIVITAERPLIERKVDRLVFNVGQSIAATGGNTMDALKVTPRVRIQNDAIEMIGKSKLGILVDGRIQQLSGEDLINFLKSIPTDGIKSIEVISNPPAKYSVEGNSGLINIITKKGKPNAWSASIWSVYRQATYATGSTGARLNLQKGKFTIQSNFDYYNGSTAPIETNQIFYPETTWRNVDIRRDFTNYLSARIALDYKINQHLSTGFSYKQLNSKPLQKSTETTKIHNAESDILDSLFVTQGRSPSDKMTNLFNYHLIYEIDTIGRKLFFDFDFFDHKNQSGRLFNNQTLDSNFQPQPNSYMQARNNGVQDIQNISMNLDMEHPTHWINLNYGGRISTIKTDNLFEHYDIENSGETLNTGLSNSFAYQENTQALYFSTQKRFSEKWEAKAGIRLEATQTKSYSQTLDQTNSNDYIKWFPTAYLAYSPNENSTFNLNYGRRIKRPYYHFLNPFRWVGNPYSYTEGNPFLQPAFIDNIELEYSYKDFWSANLYYSHTNSDFEQVAIIDEATNIQQIIPKNFIINNSVGLYQTFNFSPSKWWDIYASANIYYSTTDSKIPVTLSYLSGWNGSFSISNDLTLNKQKTLFFNISFYYDTKGVSNLDYQSSANQLDASFKWLLLDKKVTISLYANDILSSYRPTYTSYSNGIKNSFRNYYDQQYFRLSATYNFGKSFKATNWKNKNQEDLNRIN